MKTYDPLKPPDPEEWQAMDEQERIDLAESFHRHARIRLPNAQLHATIHVMVENQIALGDETPVKRTLERLMSESLDRHDALHAIGLVLAEHLNDVLAHPEGDIGEDRNLAYYEALERLTAQDRLSI